MCFILPGVVPRYIMSVRLLIRQVVFMCMLFVLCYCVSSVCLCVFLHVVALCVLRRVVFCWFVGVISHVGVRCDLLCVFDLCCVCV